MDGCAFKKEPLEEIYEIGDDIGSGHFAVVRRVTNKKTNHAYAAKFIRKRRGGGRKGARMEDIHKEVYILRQLNHNNVISLYDVYETNQEVILILELVTGGELFDYISEKDHLGEDEASAFIGQILHGLKHLHDNNIAHLDLKPENIMLLNRRSQNIKLIDFGLAQKISQKEDIRALMGTAEFVAPEVVSYESLSLATDMWSIGVITYILLSGASPFLGDSQQETYHNITAINYQFDEEYFSHTSDLAKDFIKKLFVKNPRKRATVTDCLNHPWIRPKQHNQELERKSAVINIDNFKAFMARKRWKQSMRVVSLCNRLSKSMLLRKSTDTLGSRNTLDEEKVSKLNPVQELPDPAITRETNKSDIGANRINSSQTGKEGIDTTIDSVLSKSSDKKVFDMEQGKKEEVEDSDTPSKETDSCKFSPSESGAEILNPALVSVQEERQEKQELAPLSQDEKQDLASMTDGLCSSIGPDGTLNEKILTAHAREADGSFEEGGSNVLTPQSKEKNGNLEISQSEKGDRDDLLPQSKETDRNVIISESEKGNRRVLTWQDTEKDRNLLIPKSEKGDSKVLVPSERADGYALITCSEKGDNKDLTPSKKGDVNALIPQPKKGDSKVFPPSEKGDGNALITDSKKEDSNDLTPSKKGDGNASIPESEKGDSKDLIPSKKGDGNALVTDSEKEFNDVLFSSSDEESANKMSLSLLKGKEKSKMKSSLTGPEEVISSLNSSSVPDTNAGESCCFSNDQIQPQPMEAKKCAPCTTVSKMEDKICQLSEVIHTEEREGLVNELEKVCESASLNTERDPDIFTEEGPQFWSESKAPISSIEVTTKSSPCPGNKIPHHMLEPLPLSMPKEVAIKKKKRSGRPETRMGNLFSCFSKHS